MDYDNTFKKVTDIAVRYKNELIDRGEGCRPICEVSNMELVDEHLCNELTEEELEFFSMMWGSFEETDHVFIESIYGDIIDITADQFGEEYEDVHIPKDKEEFKKYHVKCEKSLKEFSK